LISGNKPVRVTVCIRKIAFGSGVGGMERAAVRHIESMLDRGFRVRLVTAVEAMDGTPPHSLDVVNVPWPKHLSMGGGPTFGLAYALWVSRARRAIQLSDRFEEVLHFHGAAVGVLKTSDTFASAVRIVNPHGLEAFGPFSLKRVPNRLFLRNLARKGKHADKLIATDPTLESVILTSINCPAEKIEHIANAVDIDTLTTMSNGSVRESQDFQIVTVGRLVKNKGYDLLLGALKRDDVQRILPPGWRWVHFGSGPMRDELLAWAMEGPRIQLDIREDRSDSEVQRCLCVADLFVQPSRFEGSSLTTLEAMVHGRVIVGTAVGGIPDKISEGTTGFLAAEPTIDSLAGALARAISDASTGPAAAASVRKTYSASAEGDQYEELYRRLFYQRNLAR